MPITPFGLPMLLLLNERPENVYAGTVDPAVTAKRRARNKVARRSRRINRLRAH